MILTFGNLITILVVLIVLVIYRQLDRNNRSLEKVKRFSDKITDSLNKTIADKTTEIKDLTIELQVGLKTGKQILKQVQDTSKMVVEADQGLVHRVEDIDKIQIKFDDYDHVLTELVGMTARVEENLDRVHKESAFVDRVAKKVGETSGQISKVQQDLSKVREKFRQENEDSLSAITGRISKQVESRINTMSKRVDVSEHKVKDFSTYITRLEARRGDLEKQTVESLKKVFDQFEIEARARKTNLLNQFVAGLKKLLTEADTKGKKVESQISEQIEKAELRLQDQQRTFEEIARQGEALEVATFNNLKMLIDERAQEAMESLDSVKTVLADTSDFTTQLKTSLNDLEEETTAYKSDAIRRLDLSSEKLQASVFSQMEKKLDNYESEVNYRFQKLDQANSDIKAMEDNLKGLMNKVSAKVREEFKGSLRKLSDERKIEKQKAQAEITSVWDELKGLENGINDLKTKAYQSVSEQLQVFEDDFFTDLRERNQALDKRITDWEDSVEVKLADIQAAQASERSALEKRFAESLKIQMEKANRAASDGVGRINVQISDFEMHVSDRIAESEGSIKQFGDSLTAELSVIRRDTQVFLEKEIQELREAQSAQTGGLRAEVEDHVKRIEGSLQESRGDIQSSFDGTQREIEAWQSRALDQIRKTDSDISAKIASLRSETDSMMDSLHDEFGTDRDELIVQTEEQRQELKGELISLSERMESLQIELEHKSDEALALFQGELDRFQNEFITKTETLQEDLDNRIDTFRTHSSQIQEKSESMQSGLFGKIEDAHKELRLNLADIDKRIKAFTVQTKLFERADDLRSTLETGIDEMKVEVEKLSTQRKTIHDMENQLSSAKKTADEVSTKMNKILSERRQIEGIDADFKKLLSISRELDHRIETVYSSQDVLQEIQAKIRQLEELEQQTEARYDRLEKKNSIIETTTSGVDKNFQYLDTLDSNIKNMKEDFHEFSSAVDTLRSDVQVLAKNKEKSDSVVQKMEDLDGILKNLESRMEKMESAREWLARTETRFENIGKQAQEQVRLLESILKSQGNPEKSDQGAPPLDKRETVTKLAHLGWAPQEIARTTKLSRGEVELILELAPKK